MCSIGIMAMPVNFRYKEVFLKGRPRHDTCDVFLLKHPRMDTGCRAKIFAPFDALRGFSESVSAKDILYEPGIELSQNEQEELDRRLRILADLTRNSFIARKNRACVTVIHYVACADPDSESFGKMGTRKKTSGICWNVDPYVTGTILIGSERIPLENIIHIESENDLFDVYPWA